MKKERINKIILGGVKGERLSMLRTREKEEVQEKELRERESGKIKVPESKYEQEVEKKRKQFLKKADKVLRKKVVSRRILKKGKMSVHIPEFKAPSVLGDPNRFFKDTLEQERRNMFL